MHPAEQRLANLKELLKGEQTSTNPSHKYIDDLKLTITSCEERLKHVNEKGYQMVDG